MRFIHPAGGARVCESPAVTMCCECWSVRAKSFWTPLQLLHEDFRNIMTSYYYSIMALFVFILSCDVIFYFINLCNNVNFYFLHYIKWNKPNNMYVLICMCNVFRFCLYRHDIKILLGEWYQPLRVRACVRAWFCVAPPPGYLRMSQNADDHVVHVLHADAELI